MLLNDIRLHLIVFISILMSESLAKSEDELCQNPIVYSIDRFNNNTVRLFRQNDFWDLNGFPDKIKVGAKSSMKDYQFLHPVNKTARVVTVLEGSPTIKGRTFKFDGVYWWSWYNHPKFGLRYVATSAGLYWDQIPKDHGFDAVFHSGDKTDPMLIGLESDPRFSDKNMKIHYFSTKNETFVRKTSNYFDEKDFPKDLTDVFSWPPTSGSKYMLYILKADKYCILTDKQKCTEWKSISQLIGCSAVTKSEPSLPPKSSPKATPKATPNPVYERPERKSTATVTKRGEGGAGGATDREVGSPDKLIPKTSTEAEESSGEAAEEDLSGAQSTAFSMLLVVVCLYLPFI